MCVVAGAPKGLKRARPASACLSGAKDNRVDDGLKQRIGKPGSLDTRDSNSHPSSKASIISDNRSAFSVLKRQDPGVPGPPQQRRSVPSRRSEIGQIKCFRALHFESRCRSCCLVCITLLPYGQMHSCIPGTESRVQSTALGEIGVLRVCNRSLVGT